MQHLQKTRGGEYPSQFGRACTNRPRGRALSFKFFLFTPLRTLLHSSKTQLLRFQTFPHSLPKTTRVGGFPQSPVAANEFCLRRARRSTKMHSISSPWRFP